MRHFDSTRFAASFLAANGHCDATGKADANEAVLFGRQLEHIISQTYDVKYVENKGRTLVPVNTSVNNGMNIVTYRQFDESGSAKFVDSFAKDFPRSSISGKEFSMGFASIGASYGYSLQDWRAAKATGLPLDAMVAKAARNSIERKIESIIAVGDANHNMTGLLNAPSVPVKTVTSTTGMSGKVWLPTGGGTTAAPLDIFTDLAFMFKLIYDTTLTVHEADTVVFPTKIFSYLKSTLFQPTYNTKTVLEALLEANPWIKHVDVWVQCSTAGADSKGRIVVYKRDPEILEFFISQDFESMPPEMHGMEFSVNCHARVGGVQVRYPLAMAYLDGAGGSEA